MSENQNQSAGPLAAGKATQMLLNAFGEQLLRALQQIDAAGNRAVAIPLQQMVVDLAVVQLKLEAIFEELGAEQLVDPAKLTHRLMQKLDRETKALKQQNDARPNIAIASAVGGALNGRGS